MSKTAAETGITISTWLPLDEAAVIRTRAVEADRSVAAELRRALRPYLRNDERRAHQPGVVQESGGHSRHAET